MPDSRSLVGQTIAGRYQINDLLGQGGMSAVYKAFDPNLQRVVAIKIIHPHLASDPKFVIRFQDEAAAVAQLRHPNIVQVHDFNHDGDLYFMVQEFVPGETLQDRLRRLNLAERRMPMKDTLQYVIQIGRATEYAHQRSMIHRDIKPANIMLDVYGDAILMDFGIVKILGGQHHTATGAVVGTALYLPPEMIRGGAPSPQTDIYSLGVTMYEMVNGRPPFEADSAMALMMMHINDPVPDLRQLRPEVPDDLVAIIETALAKEPSERFSSMAEMSAKLQILLNNITGTQADARRAPSVSGATVQSEAHFTSTQPDVPDYPAAAAAAAAAASSAGIKPGTAEAHMMQPAASVDRPGISAAQAMRSAASGENPFPATASGFGGDYSDGGAIAVTDSGRKGRFPFVLTLALGVLAFLALIIAAVVIFVPDRSAGADGTPQAAFVNLPETTATPSSASPSSTPAPTSTATITPSPTASQVPTATPFPSLTPTPTLAPGELFSMIKAISTDEQGQYVVDYDTIEFTEKLDGTHLVFFFNTQTTDLGYMYGGPRPFTKFSLNQRPSAAAQICIRVSNADHSIRENSGNCLPLPDVVVAQTAADVSCLQGPGEQFPAVVQVPIGTQTLVRGISPDEAWWNVVNPQEISQSCWLPIDFTTTTGDISSLPLVEAPLFDTGSSTDSLRVSINAITLDDQGRFVIDYTTEGFQEQLPGVHIHFFYDTVPPEEVGITGEGNRLMYGGPSPFTGFLAADHPQEAEQICALVANPDHSIIPESGNCSNLPEHHTHAGSPTGTPSGDDSSERDQGGGGGYDY